MGRSGWESLFFDVADTSADWQADHVLGRLPGQLLHRARLGAVVRRRGDWDEWLVLLFGISRGYIFAVMEAYWPMLHPGS